MQIEIVGKVYDNQSLAKVNRNIAKSLKEDVCITALDSPSYANKVDDVSTIENLQHYNPLSKDIVLLHSYPPIFRWPSNEDSKVVYIQPWEYDTVPSEWQYKFQEYADALIVPSNFTRDAFLNAGIDPNKVFVVPNGYDPEIYYSDERADLPAKRFIFVGCGQYRKGLDILLQAWSKATSKSDPVELIIKDAPQVYGDTGILDNIIRLQYNTKCAKISYIDDVYSEREMAELYRSCDVILHPYRGEGFGMPIVEAMACGVFPVVTAGGSTDDFVLEADSKISSHVKPTDMYGIFAIKLGDSLSAMGQHRTILEPDVNDLIHKIQTLKSSKIRVPDVTNIKTWEEVGLMYSEIFERVSKVPGTVRNRNNGSSKSME